MSEGGKSSGNVRIQIEATYRASTRRVAGQQEPNSRRNSITSSASISCQHHPAAASAAAAAARLGFALTTVDKYYGRRPFVLRSVPSSARLADSNSICARIRNNSRSASI